ncbi:hypothetical protein IAR55_006362 [Kwoniella newhampshirensis]|uniref:Oxidoreductase n=1 Tax=Kwoniella newhampshirensis TaxID=1651941 RepID=A0AAW0YTS8_9TREE
MSEPLINVAFVGYGYTTRVFHLPAVKCTTGYNIYAFVQRQEFPIDKRTGKPAPSCKDDYPDAIRYSSMEDMLKDEKVELVVVVTPGESHAELCIQSLEAGKNVIVEKPFAMSVAEADKVLDAQKASGKVLSVFQSRRYDSCFRTVEKIVKSGTLGPITSAQIRYDLNNAVWARSDPNPDYIPGSGIMVGIGSHSIDQALQLFGTPSHVTGFYRSLRGIKSKTDDTYMIVLRYDDTHPDLQVIIGTELVSVMPNQLRYFVRGREGSFIKFGEDPQEEQRIGGMAFDDEKLGWEDEDRWGVLNTKTKVNDDQVVVKELWGGDVWTGKIKSERGRGADYYADLALALRGKGPLVVNPKQSRDGLKVMELARESFDTGRTLAFD